MSVKSQINRISGNVTAALNAVAEKGVNVPSGSGSDELAALIAAIQKGIDTSDATALASYILSGYTAYAKGEKITGTIPSQGAQTITPGTTDKTIASGRYLSGTQTIKGDANLIADNIAKGVSIFGVAGALEAGGGGGAKVACGEITFSAATGSHSWEHGLGATPDYAAIFVRPGYSVGATNALSLRAIFKLSSGMVLHDNYYTRTNANNHLHGSESGNMTATDTTVTVSDLRVNGNLIQFVAGKPYIWICATGVVI